MDDPDELTFAVTQTTPSRPARVRYADAAALSRGRFVECAPTAANATALLSSGRLLDGCAIRIIDGSENELDDGHIGSILIKSESLFTEYRNYPAKTREAFRDGWYISGDLGFRLDDEYYVIGRSKDVIIVAGKNIYPEDVEMAVLVPPRWLIKSSSGKLSRQTNRDRARDMPHELVRA
jgi:fatty-acyl-CoA synthase